MMTELRVGQRFQGIVMRSLFPSISPVVEMLIVLILRGNSPKGVSVVCPNDREIVERAGVAVVECSWARLEEIPFHKIKSPHERLRISFLSALLAFADIVRCTVPYLVAANPVNYGKRKSSSPKPPSHTEPPLAQPTN